MLDLNFDDSTCVALETHPVPATEWHSMANRTASEMEDLLKGSVWNILLIWLLSCSLHLLSADSTSWLFCILLHPFIFSLSTPSGEAILCQLINTQAKMSWLDFSIAKLIEASYFHLLYSTGPSIKTGHFSSRT